MSPSELVGRTAQVSKHTDGRAKSQIDRAAEVQLESQTRNILAERSEIDRVVEGKTLCTVFAQTAERYRDREALKWRTEAGWEALSWHRYREQVRDFSLGLMSLGFSPGLFGVLLTANRPEHVIASQGLIHAGGTPVGLYSALAPSQIAHLANHCEASVAVVDVGLFEKLSAVRSQLPKLEKVILVGGDPSRAPEEVVGWEELLQMGRAEHDRHPSAFEEAAAAVKPDDLAALIYTSGTSGPPKGVMISHQNALWAVESYGRRTFPALPEDRLVSFLPLAHVSEHYLSLWQPLVCGTTTHFCSDPALLLPTLLEVRPTWFLGVPRVWEKLYAGIKAAVASQEDQVRGLAERAIAVGRQVVAGHQQGRPIDRELAENHEKLQPARAAIIGKIGLDRCRFPFVSAAPSNPEVLEFFHALGLPIAELWGMTELSGPGASNQPDRIKIGTVGPAIPGVEARIAPDGELLVRGGSVTCGYYRDRTYSDQVIDDDDWLHTGDIASIDDDGYFRIVDRKKELIITSFGKNISPVNLETLLTRHPLIGQACALGDGRSYISALLVLDPESVRAWAIARNLEGLSLADLANHPEVLAEIQSAIGELNTEVSGPEQIRQFKLLPSEWTVEGGELTPTLKLKRRVITQKYALDIDQMYAQDSVGP